MTMHGAARRGGRSPEYKVWSGMIARCRIQSATDFDMYGGRGIKVCDRWSSFQAFIDDMGPRPSPEHSLDRRDPNGDYCPGNCRWATRHEQGRTKRTNHWITADGVTHVIGDWPRVSGISLSTIKQRLRLGWDPARAVTERPRRRGEHGTA